MTEQSEKKKPIDKCTSGAVTAAIFAHENKKKDGTTFTSYSIAISRAYTENDGETFENTPYLNPQNIDHAITALKKAKVALEALQEKAAA